MSSVSLPSVILFPQHILNTRGIRKTSIGRHGAEMGVGKLAKHVTKEREARIAVLNGLESVHRPSDNCVMMTVG